MSLADRPTNCPVCNKRLSRKQWYYRNGQYYCKKRCLETAQEKAKEEAAAKAKAEAEKAPPKAEQVATDAEKKSS
jgi:hypothetical protein